MKTIEEILDKFGSRIAKEPIEYCKELDEQALRSRIENHIDQAKKEIRALVPEKKRMEDKPELIIPKHYYGRERQYIEDVQITLDGYNQAIDEILKRFGGGNEEEI